MNDAVLPVWPAETDETTPEQAREGDEAVTSGEPSAAVTSTAQAIARLLGSILGPGALPATDSADVWPPGPGATGGGHRTLN